MLIQLFKRIVQQFKLIYKKTAFLQNYKQFDIFKDGTEEFDDCQFAV